MAEQDIHKTSANTPPPSLIETETPPVNVTLDPSSPSVISIARVVVITLILLLMENFFGTVQEIYMI